MPYIRVHIDADDVLDELDTQELIDELVKRNKANEIPLEMQALHSVKPIVEELYQTMTGQEWPEPIRRLFYEVLGKIV